MKKFLVGLSMVLLGGYVSTLTRPKESAKNLVEQTVQISMYYKPLFQEDEYKYNYLNICAGVWVGEKHVLTAAHCVGNNKILPRDEPGAEQNEIVLTELYEIYLDTSESVDNKTYLAKAQRVSHLKDCDLAVLRITSPLTVRHEIAQVREHNLSLGEKVQTVGHPGRFSWLYTSGEVTSVNNEIEDLTSCNVININIGHGCSGGGLFDSNNKLVGITQAIYESGEEKLSLYSTQTCIKTILDSTKESEAKKRREW